MMDTLLKVPATPGTTCVYMWRTEAQNEAHVGLWRWAHFLLAAWAVAASCVEINLMHFKGIEAWWTYFEQHYGVMSKPCQSLQVVNIAPLPCTA